MSEQRAMSRAVRTARGAFGALAATLLAAVSHALAGGLTTAFAVVATALFALPLCVLLAGKIGSLWRLAIAVSVAQFVYHWSFAGIGASQLGAGASGSSAEAISPHAAHLGLLASSPFVPTASTGAIAANAEAVMWVAHALAAALTVALMHSGERAFLHVVRLLRSAVPVHVPGSIRLPSRPAILETFYAAPSRVAPVFLSAISHRGPPALPATATSH